MLPICTYCRKAIAGPSVGPQLHNECWTESLYAKKELAQFKKELELPDGSKEIIQYMISLLTPSQIKLAMVKGEEVACECHDSTLGLDWMSTLHLLEARKDA